MEAEEDWRSCSRSKGTKSMDLGASLIAMLLFPDVVVVVAVVHNSNSADVGNYTEKEENIHPDKAGNVVAAVADVVTGASAALQLEIALVAVAEVAVEVHDDYYRVIPRRCMAIVKAVEVCHDLSCWSEEMKETILFLSLFLHFI